MNHEDIPLQYGIIEVGYNAKIARKAKMLHKNKILDDKYFLKKLMDKFYWKTIIRCKLYVHKKKLLKIK